MKTEAGRVKCQCDHMTNFAVLFSASGPKTHEDRHAMALSIISYVGCAISLVGLTLTLITYSLFRFVRFLLSTVYFAPVMCNATRDNMGSKLAVANVQNATDLRLFTPKISQLCSLNF